MAESPTPAADRSALIQTPVLVGRPFAPIGMGELVRSSCRAFREIRHPFRLLDIYKMDEPDADLTAEFGPYLTTEMGPINIFHMNGDEIEMACQRLDGLTRRESYNILYPTWELSNYPAEWAASILSHFNEVWACSGFVRDSLAGCLSIPVRHLPLAVQPKLRSLLGRRHFGIPETSYAFLFLFDFTSYIERKYPFASLAAFKRLLQRRPNADARFVVKLNSSKARPQDLQRFMDFVLPFRERVIVIDQTLTDNEVKNLHLCCDAFVSLHRSEGFGFGCAEAMYFGKPVIGTAYSGNMDFMTEDTAILVDYQLVPVPHGAYPHAGGQMWAEPDIEQASEAMGRLVDAPALGREIGERASRRVRAYFSHRATGLRYGARLREILADWSCIAA
jgi:glycosyltransferase involved in cell wall biosynthesis